MSPAFRRATLCLLLAAPLNAQQATLTPRDSALHVLNRLAWGAAPGQVEQIARQGVMRWIDRQLGVTEIDDPALADLRGEYDILRLTPEALLRRYVQLQQDQRTVRREADRAPGMTPGQPAGNPVPGAREFRALAGELQQLVVVRATRSDHQLAEVMADFWTNHFNVFYGKNLDRVYLPAYIEGTIRPRAMGSFEALLVATAKSPAMMVYLDNAQSIAPGARPPQFDRLKRAAARRGRGADSMMREVQRRMPTGLNENYARELLELHTLGVDGGYGQKDVTEVARVLTGWSVERPMQGGDRVYNGWAHDPGAKLVLGLEFPAGGGEEEGMKLLSLLAAHPSTAHYLSGKLCARFVNDSPPDGCIDDAVGAWKRSGGDIREVLGAIFRSPDFWAPVNVAAKIKTPLEFIASAVRAVGGVPDTTARLAQAVTRLGQPLYLHTAPNGYPERQDDWVNSGALLARMNLAVQLAANRLPGVRVDLDRILPAGAEREVLVDAVNRVILNGRMTPQTRRVILDQVSGMTDSVEARMLAVGLALGGPEFQRQ